MPRRSIQRVPQLRFAGEHDGVGDVAFHDHPVPELILVVKGECRTETSAANFHSQPGDLLCIPAGVSHNQIDFGDVRTLYVGFESSRFNIKQPCQFRMTCCELIEHSLWMLFELHTCQWSGGQSSAGHLLALLLDAVHGVQTPDQKATLPRRLVDLQHWLETHLDGELSVERLAEQVGLSASRLFQLFENHLGLSPMQYVQIQRMARARQYLMDPYLTVKQIAPLCGYSDVNLFIRTFRRHHQLPPRRWRLKNCV